MTSRRIAETNDKLHPKSTSTMYTNPTFLASSDDRLGWKSMGPEFHWPNSTTGIAVCEAIGRETRTSGKKVEYGNTEVACRVRPERAAMGMAPASPRWQRKKKSAKVKPRELRRVSHLGAWPRGLGRCWLGIVRLVVVAGIPVEIIGRLHHPHSSQSLIDSASERFTAIPQLVLSLV